MVDKKNSKFSIIIGIIFAISWIIVLVMRKSNQNISLTPYVIVSLILTLAFITSLFGKKFYKIVNKLKEKEKEMQKTISESEVEEIVNNEVEKMWTYIEKGTAMRKITHNKNKNLIYEIKVKLYSTVKIDDSEKDECIILINATYPNKQPTILDSSTSREEIENKVNLLSDNPTPEADEKIIETENKAMGYRSIIKEKTHRTQDEKPKEEDVV